MTGYQSILNTANISGGSSRWLCAATGRRLPCVKRIQALFAVALDTGLRYGELASLWRRDIDGRSMMLVVDGKVGQRRVPSGIWSPALSCGRRHISLYLRWLDSAAISARQVPIGAFFQKFCGVLAYFQRKWIGCPTN